MHDRRPLGEEPDLCGPGERWADRCESYPAGVRVCVLPDPPERTT